MEAKDLRIGNYINDGAVVNCVQGITHGRTIYVEPFMVDGRNTPITSYRISQIKPIPLYESWLVGFGFKEIKSHILDSYDIDLPLIGDKKLSISIQHGNQYMYVSDWEKGEIKASDMVCIRNSDSHGTFYVHQLQNLYFALTSTELERKKEKVIQSS